MKSTLTKITAFTLVLTFLTASIGIIPPKKVEAQGKAFACIAGYVTAGLSALASIPQNIIGVSKSQGGDTAQNITTGGSANALSFNECVLKPIAKVMIVTLIRNIGASVVTWVNSGFEGKPSFVTDFGGTLLDAADEVAGQLIEGTELGFLCNNFSFQIRIALALKYSQPFREKARCTLSEIGNNVSNFADNNGGAGWDNWLKITTEPQNNVYGAYVIADSELAQRMLTAVTTKKEKITLGNGFLDYETCDRWAEPNEGSYIDGVFVPNTSKPEVLNQNTTFGALKTEDLSTSNSKTKKVVPQGTKFVDPKGKNRTCIEKSTKTPGTVIAGKINSTFAQGEIQQAVAQEIDDVIAATMNQLAQKMIQGTYGLLGLSKKKSGTSQSNLQRYQNQYYGGSDVAIVDSNTGATSEIEDYTVRNYDEAQSLIESNSLVKDINRTTENTANAAVKQNTAQQEGINNSLGGDIETTQNLAINKVTSQSSAGGGSSDKAVNGVKDGDTSQYNKVSQTGEEQNPWWEVDLGGEKTISEVRIWKVTNKPVEDTLGTIRIVASNEGNTDVWMSEYITPTQSGQNPIVIPVNLNRRIVRVEKKGSLDETCREVPASFRGRADYESCYHPLELAEVEVMGSIKNSTKTTGGTVSGATETSQNIVADQQKTIGFSIETKPDTLSGTNPFVYKIDVVANHATGSLSVKHTFKRNDVTITTGSVLADLTVKTKTGSGITGSTNPAPTSGTMQWNNISVSATEKFSFTLSGTKTPGATAGDYTIVSELLDGSGRLLKTQTTDFVVQ